jgi:hypothetical protein
MNKPEQHHHQALHHPTHTNTRDRTPGLCDPDDDECEVM